MNTKSFDYFMHTLLKRPNFRIISGKLPLKMIIRFEVLRGEKKERKWVEVWKGLEPFDTVTGDFQALITFIATIRRSQPSVSQEGDLVIHTW